MKSTYMKSLKFNTVGNLGVFFAVSLFTFFFLLSTSSVFGAALQNYNLGASGSTNFEVGEAVWTGNIFQVQTRAGGTGVLRAMQITTGSNVGIYITTGGLVGIGTNNPSAMLSVTGGGVFTQPVTVATPLVDSHAATKGYVDSAVLEGGAGAGQWTISGSNIYYNVGNVGIGTSNPTTRFHVVGTTTISGMLEIGGVGSAPSESGPIYRTAFYDEDNPAYYMDPASTSTSALFAGNVGIGTTAPGYVLDVVGNARFIQPVIVGTPTGSTHAATKAYVDAAAFGGGGPWTLAGSYVYNTGYSVGIGTATPSSALDVVGSFYTRMVEKGNCSGAVAIDWSQGNTQRCVLTGNVTFTFSNGRSGGNYRLVLRQDVVGSRTAVWPASVRWGSGGLPTLTTTGNRTDYVGFIYNGTDGAYDGVAFNTGF